MKQIIASVFLNVLSYIIGNISFCIFKNIELNFIIITARVFKLWLAEANFLSCFYQRKVSNLPPIKVHTSAKC